MYDEMRFLFSVDPSIRNTYNVAEKNVVANVANPVQSIEVKKEWDDTTKRFNLNNYVIDKGNVKNYVKNFINRPYTTNINPYLDLLKFSNESETAKSLKLSSSDFAYLRDIGVMPINRLMILRRYPEGVVVPVDLSDLEVEPISVVVGWVKKDTNLLNFTFNEVWRKQGSGDMLHLMLNRIIKDEFGVDMSAIIPIPGWGLGFMFGILHEMGLTNYDKTYLPIGDPNVLKEAITRPHEEFGLESSFNFELETVYEQKYIAGLDPTVSSLEIIRNLLRMGTSNVEFIGKKGSKFEKAIRAANENPSQGRGWAKAIGDVFTAFTNALQKTLSEEADHIAEVFGALKPIKEEKPQVTETSKEKKDREAADKLKAQELDKKKKTDPDGYKDDLKKASEARGKEAVTAFAGLTETILQSEMVTSILASTIARYQWPLRGSISMFTGDASTPWHLTIGNPYAPLLSINNIWVKSVNITGGKDMGFNDMPRIMEIKITMEQGRSLGKQEIYDLFGVRYKREYNKFQSAKGTANVTQ